MLVINKNGTAWCMRSLSRQNCCSLRYSKALCRIYEGLLTSSLDCFSNQGSENLLSRYTLQHTSLEFLRQVLDAIPIALQTVRASSAWHKIFQLELLFPTLPQTDAKASSIRLPATKLPGDPPGKGDGHVNVQIHTDGNGAGVRLTFEIEGAKDPGTHCYSSATE